MPPADGGEGNVHRRFDDSEVVRWHLNLWLVGGGYSGRKPGVEGCHQNQIVGLWGALPAGDRAGGVDEQVGIGHGFESGGGRGDQPEGDRPNEQRGWHFEDEDRWAFPVGTLSKMPVCGVNVVVMGVG